VKNLFSVTMLILMVMILLVKVLGTSKSKEGL